VNHFLSTHFLMSLPLQFADATVDPLRIDEDIERCPGRRVIELWVDVEASFYEKVIERGGVHLNNPILKAELPESTPSYITSLPSPPIWLSYVLSCKQIGQNVLHKKLSQINTVLKRIKRLKNTEDPLVKAVGRTSFKRFFWVV